MKLSAWFHITLNKLLSTKKPGIAGLFYV